MDKEFGELVIKESLPILLPEILNFFKLTLSKNQNPFSEINFENHIKKVCNWASSYNFLGLGIPKNCAEESISLRLSSTPRRFRSKIHINDSSTFTEDSFLEDDYSLLLLGDPGGGKTTTLKRLALRLLTQQESSKNDIYQIPILVIMKELSSDTFLLEYIANIVNLPFQRQPKGEVKYGKVGVDFKRSDFDIISNENPLEEQLAGLLNNLNAVIIIDGLDEISREQKAVIEQEIESLSVHLNGSKIIVSCRSGDYTTNLQGFKILEILPLNQNEIKEMATIWLQDPDDFLEMLNNTPYSDIIDRPLLLTFLLFLYNTEHDLPEQPSLIYRKVVYRLLKDWDEERRIKRISKYSNFDPDRKIDFLSELAYFLTYQIQGRRFTHSNFNQAYIEICNSFNLPIVESKSVASEIETHTGIITENFDGFEFSHLSIQEYLCANYICRSPFPDLLNNYLSEYPAPIAVACALSSNPSRFFSEIIVRHVSKKFKNRYDRLHGSDNPLQLCLDLFGEDTATNLRSFISRLLIEKPAFKADLKFGESLLCLMAFYYRRYSEDVDKILNFLLMTDPIRMSIEKALIQFKNTKFYLLTQRTVIFEMDSWFKSIYEESVGPWILDENRQKMLPLVMLPREYVPKIYEGNILQNIKSEIRDRVVFTLKASPFCILDTGEHSFPEYSDPSGLFRKNECKVCGYKKSSKPRTN